MNERALVRTVAWSLLGLTLLAVALLAMVELLRSRSADGGAGPPPVYAEVPDFALTNRDGRTVRRADLAGGPWIADFVFSRCTSSCPLMTEALARLGERLPPLAGFHRVSFTVDPGFDTPEVLAAYARRHGIDDPSWLFLTGPRDEIYALMEKGFKLPYDASGTSTGPAPNILHSTRFVLVDGAGRIRGYYQGLEAADRRRLVADLLALAG